MATDASHDDKNGMPRVRFGPIRWLDRPLRTAVEETVSEHAGRAWGMKSLKDLSEFACHRCAVVSDGSLAVFFKYGEAAEAKRQFDRELSDLRILSERAGVLTPRPIGMVEVERGTVLIMEALEAIEPGPRHWKQIGTTLARIHGVKGDRCGFETKGFCGPLVQDNTPAQDWATFYAERRLLPRLRVAVDSGNMPSAVATKIEMLIPRLPELCGPETPPSLLHGDAQQNNFICAAEGIFVIDPAVYYGHPEMDLALLDSFQPAPDAVFDGYQAEMPIDPGFRERCDLWRIPLYLAAVAIEGPMHLNRLTDAVGTYS